MRYVLIASNGQRYGPVDIPTLNQWATEGRLRSSDRLMEEMGGTIVQASSVVGIAFPQAAPPALAQGPMQPPPPGAYAPIQPAPPGAYQAPSNYPRPGYPPAPGYAYMPTASGDNGSKEMWTAFGIAFGAPLLGCITMYGIFLAIAGVGAAWRAMQKGQKWAILALILNILSAGAAFYMRFILRYQLFNRY